MGPPTGGGGKTPSNFNQPQNTNQPPNSNWRQQNPNQRQQYQGFHGQPRTNTAPQEQLPYRGQFDEQLPPSSQPPPYEPPRNQDYNFGAMAGPSTIPRPQTVPSNQGASFQEDYDETDRGMNVNVNVNYQEVANETPSIFTSFLVNRLDHDGYDVPQGLRRSQERNNE